MLSELLSVFVSFFRKKIIFSFAAFTWVHGYRLLIWSIKNILYENGSHMRNLGIKISEWQCRWKKCGNMSLSLFKSLSPCQYFSSSLIRKLIVIIDQVKGFFLEKIKAISRTLVSNFSTILFFLTDDCIQISILPPLGLCLKLWTWSLRIDGKTRQHGLTQNHLPTKKPNF